LNRGEDDGQQEGVGLTLAASALLLSLLGVDLLVFYFRQFATIITASIQFVLLLLVYRYRSQVERTKQKRLGRRAEF
jgi:membrane protein implicated in regulation of membrane protease activity